MTAVAITPNYAAAGHAFLRDQWQREQITSDLLLNGHITQVLAAGYSLGEWTIEGHRAFLSRSRDQSQSA
jgi:hypothetical protein